ncbi:PepSY-associated TM helix domain-containing protein [Acidomonas methanolica]|uniref:Peptidase PepSY-associated transmembrane protein n=3 Tax=Acidomonas methanolica TaxID=437 RepID=A0A023D7V4_ACIMT|nr:PepSY domain-containing protein [Acidomonas methanolica]MBU2653772.1 PepSY domain-containing protein [Acidomonas methanolica]TCS31725.1 putative iron-regulated membrane protein [Acidomonas methanolica]GAJ30189.1 peptidase PepSY-associated transmembrane protein [Acidomonas methanolica NBRC 104435]GEK98141.1 membrane protein [Acidomonas methanolica NBRC 104435]
MSTMSSRFWPDERTVWRWHFFAGLFCLPFVVLLCLTGTIYLFKPQIDQLIDRRFDHLPGHPTATPAREVRAALAALPGAHLLAYELPPGPAAAARVILVRRGEAIRVLVDPATSAVLKIVPEESRFERIVFRLHGQLLLGNAGSVVMEMVASWTFVLIGTGLFLWWPRGGRNAGGVLLPRLGKGRRTWRDLHAVTGLWVSLLLALFLLSGLPWSFLWGHALARVEATVGRLTTIKAWEIGAVPAAVSIAGQPMAGMNMDAPAQESGDDLAGLDRAVTAASRLGWPAPVLLTPPRSSGGNWTVRSDAQDRPRRVSAEITPSGALRGVRRFADKPLMDRLVGYGVAMHEGQLFGWANQALNLIVALGLLVMSAAALVIWTRRRPPGRLGAPPRLSNRRVGWGAVVSMVIFGVILPELGAALLMLGLASALADLRRKGKPRPPRQLAGR